VLGHRSRLATAALVAVFALLPAACGGDDGEAADEDDRTTTTARAEDSTTTTAPSAEAEVEAAYLAQWEMNERLAAAPDPNDPEIDIWTIGTAKDDLVEALTTLMAQGQAVRFDAEYSHDVLSIDVAPDGQSAQLIDCNVDDATVIDAATGEEVESATATNYLDVSMTLTADGWKVEGFDRLEVWEGVRQCV
jgi:ABC-type glycerol-3-phosphate transport system substrate-binding protein